MAQPNYTEQLAQTRLYRIGEIKKVINSGVEIDIRKFVIEIQRKFGVSKRVAREYLELADVRGKLFVDSKQTKLQW